MRSTPAAALAAAFALSAAACSESPTEVRPADAAPDLSVGTSAAQVTVLPGQSIQAAVNANPAGTTFLLKAGTFKNQAVFPKSGDVFIGEPGAVLDGGRTTQIAFQGKWPFPSNVRISGLEIRNYAPPLRHGAISANHTTGWVIANNEVHHNGRVGITFGSHTQILNNRIHHNDQIGVRGSDNNVLLQGNEIAYNNPDWHYPYGGELGGIKLYETDSSVVRGNYVHHNNGNGIWADGNDIHTLVENNRVVANHGLGIFNEISYKAVIRNNAVSGNGFGRTGMYAGGIFISSSQDAEVYGNTVTGNKMGITATQEARGDGLYGPHLTKNLYVHDNTVQTAGQTGLSETIGNSAVFTRWNNRFVHNTYTGLANNNTPFVWMHGKRTVAQWKAYGQDVTGTFLQ